MRLAGPQERPKRATAPSRTLRAKLGALTTTLETITAQV